MKKFVLKVLYFVLPLIIIATPLDIAISYFLSQSSHCQGEFEVWNDIYNSTAKCDIAIYGSSRAWVHIDPKIISDSLYHTAYNFGVDGHNFWVQYLRHLEFLKCNQKPKIIILSVDIFSLQKRIDLYNSDQFLPYMLWNNNIIKSTSSYVGYDKFDYYIPFVRYIGNHQALEISKKIFINGASEKPYRNNGFLGMDLEWNEDFESAVANQKFYKIKFVYSLNK